MNLSGLDYLLTPQQSLGLKAIGQVNSSLRIFHFCEKRNILVFNAC